MRVLLLWILPRLALALNQFSTDLSPTTSRSTDVALTTPVNITSSADGRRLYRQLVDELFQDYSPSIPPNSANPSRPVDISLELVIEGLGDLDMQSQRLTLYVWLAVRWLDPVLAWDTMLYPVDRLVVSEKKVWRPSLIVGNSVLAKDQLMKIELPVTVRSRGQVGWFPCDSLVLDCPVDLRHYPFDQQTCSVSISQWSVEKDVNVSEENIHHLVKTSGNGEWDILGVHSERMIFHSDTEQSWTVKYQLTLRRKWLFYALNVLFPMALVSALISVVFLLPVNSGDKMSVSVTNFLTLAVFMTLMQDSLPQNSDTVCYLAVYLASQLVLGALAVVLSAVTVGWCHGHTHPARVGAAEPGAGMEAQQKTMDDLETKDGSSPSHPTMEARAHRMDVICFRLFIIISVLSFIIYCLSISI